MNLSPVAQEASRELAASLTIPTPALPVGLHLEVPEDVYHQRQLGVASKSALDKIRRSPAHYHAWATCADEDEDTPALRFGRAFHTAVLEPAKYQPAKSTKKDREDAEAITGMVASLRAHPIAGRLLSGGHREVTIRWDAGGVPCKGRLDGYHPELLGGVAFDLKSTTDASPEEFARSVARYGYARQEAFYRDGLAALGRAVPHFLFLVCEKAPPYCAAVYALSVDAVSRGRVSIVRDLETLAACCASGVFPGYPDGITTLELPRWAE